MDPYLEDPAVWPDFHPRLVAALRESLLAALAGRPFVVVTRTRRYHTLSEDYRWLDATLQAHGLRGPTPSAEEVAVAAYYLWEEEGRPHGRDREHWDRALTQLRRNRTPSGVSECEQ